MAHFFAPNPLREGGRGDSPARDTLKKVRRTSPRPTAYLKATYGVPRLEVRRGEGGGGALRGAPRAKPWRAALPRGVGLGWKRFCSPLLRRGHGVRHCARRG